MEKTKKFAGKAPSLGELTPSVPTYICGCWGIDKLDLVISLINRRQRFVSENSTGLINLKGTGSLDEGSFFFTTIPGHPDTIDQKIAVECVYYRHLEIDSVLDELKLWGINYVCDGPDYLNVQPIEDFFNNEFGNPEQYFSKREDSYDGYDDDSIIVVPSTTQYVSIDGELMKVLAYNCDTVEILSVRVISIRGEERVVKFDIGPERVLRTMPGHPEEAVGSTIESILEKGLDRGDLDAQMKAWGITSVYKD